MVLGRLLMPWNRQKMDTANPALDDYLSILLGLEPHVDLAIRGRPAGTYTDILQTKKSLVH